MATYHRIPAHSVPDHVVFHTPGREQGQVVETAYGAARVRGARFGEWVTPRGEAGPGDRYMRELDRSLPDGHSNRVRYFIRRPG